jgi:hypothetical protein
VAPTRMQQHIGSACRSGARSWARGEADSITSSRWPYSSKGALDTARLVVPIASRGGDKPRVDGGDGRTPSKGTGYDSACAAAGQLGLMSLYEALFSTREVASSQVSLSLRRLAMPGLTAGVRSAIIDALVILVVERSPASWWLGVMDLI